MDQLKHAFKAAVAIGIAAAIAFVTLVLIGGALAIAGFVVAAALLVGGIWALFGKKPLGGKGREPLTVVYTRIEETDIDGGPRRR